MAAETLHIGTDGGVRAEIDLPSGARPEGPGGVDSIAGTIRGPEYVCIYDLGPYANPLSGLAGTEETHVAGRPARLVQDGDFLGLHIPDLAREGLGITGLTITCKGPGVAGNADLVAMLRSVRLRP